MSSSQIIQSAVFKSRESQLSPDIPLRKCYEILNAGPQVSSLDALENTQLNYNFAIPAGTAWRADQSFFRYTLKIKKKVGSTSTPIEQGHVKLDVFEDDEEKAPNLSQDLAWDVANGHDLDVALSFNALASPFQNIVLNVAGVPVDSTSNIQIVDSWMKRMTLSSDTQDFYGDSVKGAWWTRHRAFTKGLEAGQAPAGSIKQEYILENKVYSCEDGVITGLWRPSYSFWNTVMPSGQYSLNMQTLTKAQILNRMFESLSGAIDVLTDLEIGLEMKFYICTQVVGAQPSSVVLDLSVCDYQAKDIGALIGQQGIDIKPSTYMVHVGFQSLKNNTGNYSHWPISNFIVQGKAAAGKHIVAPNNQLQIKELYSEYSGNIFPINRFRVQGDGSDNDLYREIFFSNQIQMGNVVIGKGFEKYSDFMYLGPYYSIPVSPDDCNTRLNSYYDLATNLDPADRDDVKHLALVMSRARVDIHYNERGDIVSVQKKFA